MKNKLTETQLASIVIDHLKQWHWEVYQEVVGPGGRCDIIAKQGNILWAIECKLNFGFSVIEQAYNWKPYTNYVSIAVPANKSRFANNVCKDYGIGILVSRREYFREIVKPKLNRKVIDRIKLYDEQKTTLPAGSAGGGYWTDFKRTVANLINKVNEKPGIEFHKLIKELDHHYSSLGSAKSCLRNFIGTKVIPELEMKTVNGKLCVFPIGRKLKRKNNFNQFH